jgi:hypothetical protein
VERGNSTSAAPSTSQVARPRASMSVACMTQGPGPRVAALLDTLRPVAEEIIVALDDRADPSVRRALTAVADRILLYPFAEPVDRPLPWLFDHCRGDWMLALDDDEIPSLALIDAIPDLCAQRDVVHYSLPRRWLYPDSSTYLDESPWRPDYQLRLVRRDLRLIRFSDEFHRPITAAGPGRFVEHPLWHLDPVVRSHEQRLEKARHYERIRPGMRIDGRALNFAFYLPETRRDPELASVPPDDAALIEAILQAGGDAWDDYADVQHATREQIDARWPITDPTRQSGRLELLERPRMLIAGEQRTLDVRVHNTGDGTWEWGWDTVPEIRVGSRWYAADGTEVRASQLRSAFPVALAPGRSELVPVHVLAPDAPGSYRVEIDLIHEHVGWFGAAAECRIEVTPARRIAVIGDDADVRRTLTVLEKVPELEPVILRRAPKEGPEGYPEAPDGRSFLFDGAPRQRRLFAVVLVGRSIRLALAAVALRRGRTPGLPRGGDGFLAAVKSCELLVVAGIDASPERREHWRVALTTRIARLLGVAVVSSSEAPDLLLLVARD